MAVGVALPSSQTPGQKTRSFHVGLLVAVAIVRPLPPTTPVMSIHLRIARPVLDLCRTVAQYKQGLGFEELAHFADHDGFDGTMLGFRDADFHFEFTVCRRHPVTPQPTPEDLFVFYVPDHQAWTERCQAMRGAGFKEVESFNPYWSQQGCTFEDADGYRVVIQRAAWRSPLTPQS